MKVGAIILAGGNGARFGADVPKQFIPLNGKPMWKHAHDTFSSHGKIGYIVTVFPKEYAPAGMGGIALAGKTRRESVKNGLEVMKMMWPECEYVLIHDAARPLVSHGIISRCIYSLQEHEAVDVTILSADTIVEVDRSGEKIMQVPDRRTMRLGQTPQGFSFNAIVEAHANTTHEIEFTDDVGVFRMCWPQKTVGNVHGEERNMKVTTQGDLIKAERMAREIPSEKVRIEVGNALIYGGTGGIGREVVKLLRDETCPVTMIWGKDECKLSGTHERLHKIEREFLDYMVISVGTLKVVKADDAWTAWDDEFDNAFTHIARFLGTVKRRGIMRKGGSIVVVGSSSAYQGRENYTAYCAGKAALVNFVQGFAQEWKDVRLNVVNPARTDTPMRRKMFPNEDTSQLCSAEEVALSIVRVLGTQVTGCVFDVRAHSILA